MDSDTNDERSVKCNYRSNHDTLEEPKEEVLKQTTRTQPAELESKALTPPIEEALPVQILSATTVHVDKEDTMSDPYPRYNDELDTEGHVHAFLTMWRANHVS